MVRDRLQSRIELFATRKEADDAHRLRFVTLAGLNYDGRRNDRLGGLARSGLARESGAVRVEWVRIAVRVVTFGIKQLLASRARDRSRRHDRHDVWTNGDEHVSSGKGGFVGILCSAGAGWLDGLQPEPCHTRHPRLDQQAVGPRVMAARGSSG